MVRALAPLNRRGFDPDEIDHGEQLLTGFAAQFGPKDLRRLAKQVVDAIDPDGTLPDDQLQQDRRFFRMRPTKDGGYAGEFRLTGDCGAKLQALLHPAGETPDQHHDHRRGPADRGTRPPLPWAADARRPPDVCDRLLRSDNAVPDSGGTPATVIVTIDLDDLLNQDRLRGHLRRHPDQH